MRTKNVRPFRTDTSFASLEPRLPSPTAYITGFSIAPTVTLASAGDTDGTPSIVYWLRARKWPSSIRSTALLLLAVFVACPLALTLCAASSKEQVVAAPAKPLAFEKDILPIFQRNCLRCHSSTLKNGGLDLSTLDGVTAGSSSGPVVVAKRPEASKVYELIHNGSMPLDRKTQVSGPEMEKIRLWIDSWSLTANADRLIVQLNQNDVIPILLRHCTPCHGPLRQEGGLSLWTRALMLAGGKSGPGFVPGKPESSLILQKILAKQMPPVGVFETGVTQPTESEVEKLKLWIAGGAPEVTEQPGMAGTRRDLLVTDQDRNFWAFQAPRFPRIPTVRHQDRVRNPIDAFILQKLEAKGLTLSPEADSLALIRRVYFDLTGLPPTPEDVRKFVADKDPQAYEKAVDRLLDSPRYGERWGRYWLDSAGYADTEYSWRYRDYVIRAFNTDKPYDRFLMEQIAGDELVDYEHAPVITPEMMDNLIATGFLRMTEDRTDRIDMQSLQARVDVITDEMQVFGSAVLGLTIQCAQCHDHKLEPIPQRDYYRLRAVFKGAFDEYDWLPPKRNSEIRFAQVRLLPYVTPVTNPIALMEQEEIRQASNEKYSARIKTLKAALEEQAKPLEEAVVEERLAKVPRELHDDLRQMLKTPLDKRNDRQRYLAEKFEHYLKVDPYDREDLLKYRYPEYRKTAQETEEKVLALQSRKIPEPYICALWDRGNPSPTYIYKRGDYQNPGRLVGPGVPSVLTDDKTPFFVTAPWPGAHKTGARLALARWLVRPDNSLTARVWVNRLWQHHFANGIVATPGNFGRSGSRPSHPELLDWLALQLVSHGWSTKAMQRLIMTSSTYRQSSRVGNLAEKFDSSNGLLSRMPLKRLDAETVRDSILFVAGRLDETRYGAPELLFMRDDGMVLAPEGWRRSIYLEQRRVNVLTMLDLFDYPQMGPNCIQRTNTAVAPQALFLLNDTKIRTLADSLAQRIRNAVGDSLAEQVKTLYWLALSRPPSVDEERMILEELGRAYEARLGQPDETEHVLARLCHTIINSSAFMYVE